MVIEAARAAAAGADTDAVVARVRELQPHCGVALTLDTLDYLYKGGRIGRAQHLVGGLLRFRPVLHMDGGELAPLARPRTRRKAVARLLQYTAERAGGNELAMAGILHGDAPDAAAELRRQVEARFKVGEVYESQIGPVYRDVYRARRARPVLPYPLNLTIRPPLHRRAIERGEVPPSRTRHSRVRGNLLSLGASREAHGVLPPSPSVPLPTGEGRLSRLPVAQRRCCWTVSAARSTSAQLGAPSRPITSPGLTMSVGRGPTRAVS